MTTESEEETLQGYRLSLRHDPVGILADDLKFQGMWKYMVEFQCSKYELQLDQSVSRRYARLVLGPYTLYSV
jgi:hypothetical protein